MEFCRSIKLLKYYTKFYGYLCFLWEKVHRFPLVHKGVYFLKVENSLAIQTCIDCGSPLPRGRAG